VLNSLREVSWWMKKKTRTAWQLSMAVPISSLLHSDYQQLAAMLLHFVTL